MAECVLQQWRTCASSFKQAANARPHQPSQSRLKSPLKHHSIQHRRSLHLRLRRWSSTHAGLDLEAICLRNGGAASPNHNFARFQASQSHCSHTHLSGSACTRIVQIMLCPWTGSSSCSRPWQLAMSGPAAVNWFPRTSVLWTHTSGDAILEGFGLAASWTYRKLLHPRPHQLAHVQL